MSQENVEIVRRWITAMSAGLDEALSAVAECCDADIDYYPMRKFPEAEPCHGRREVSKFVERYLQTWDRFEQAVEELVAIDDSRVLSRQTLRAGGRGSELNIEAEFFSCVWLRHGRFLRVEDHSTLRGALHGFGFDGDTLEDVGLSESS